MVSIRELSGVIYDVDDVLLDNGNRPGEYVNNLHSRSRLAAVHEVGERQNLPALYTLTPQANVEAFLASTVHTVAGGVWQILIRAGLVAPDSEIDPNHELVQAVARLKEIKYVELVRTEGKLVPGAKQFVRAVGRRDIPQAIASNAERWAIDMTLGFGALGPFFPDQCIISNELITRPKPDRQAYELAYQSLDLPDDARQFTLGIDDDPRGLASAHGAGLLVAGMATRFTKEQLQAHSSRPLYVASDFFELADMIELPLGV